MNADDLRSRGWSDSTLIARLFTLYGHGLITSFEEGLLVSLENQGWSAPGDPSKFNGRITVKQRQWAYDIVEKHDSK